MEKNNNEFGLDVEVMGHIAQLLQLALITGTDIIDQFSLMRLERSKVDDTKLVLADSYKKQAEENISRLIEKAEELSDSMKEELDQMSEAFGNTDSVN